MKRQKMVMTTLHCEECGNPFTIARKLAKQKEDGHIKHMYCPSCKETRAFIEGVRSDPKQSFWDEWHASQMN